jgi:hypothetical protein
MLKDLNEVVKVRNMQAMHMHNRGGKGRHEEKQGKNAKRSRRKQAVRKQIDRERGGY